MYMPVCTLCVCKLDVQAVVNYLTGCWVGSELRSSGRAVSTLTL